MAKLLSLLAFTLVFCSSDFSVKSALSSTAEIPWEPIPREDSAWIEMHNDFIRQSNELGDRLRVIFFGDSGTEFFNSAVWEANYENLPSVKYGIQGDKIQHLLWRILNGETVGVSPKVVVLLIGANNQENSNIDAVRGIRANVDAIRSLLPQSKILLLGILPALDPIVFPRIKDVNEKISEFDDGVNIRFLDMFDHFILDGNLNMDFYVSDRMHLTYNGYLKWAEVMNPLFYQLLNS